MRDIGGETNIPWHKEGQLMRHLERKLATS